MNSGTAERPLGGHVPGDRPALHCSIAGTGATPRIMSSDRYETFSMDDESVFDPEAYRLPFAEAIVKER